MQKNQITESAKTKFTLVQIIHVDKSSYKMTNIKLKIYIYRIYFVISLMLCLDVHLEKKTNENPEFLM